jgi:hypothetical protein
MTGKSIGKWTLLCVCFMAVFILLNIARYSVPATLSHRDDASGDMVTLFLGVVSVAIAYALCLMVYAAVAFIRRYQREMFGVVVALCAVAITYTISIFFIDSILGSVLLRGGPLNFIPSSVSVPLCLILSIWVGYRTYRALGERCFFHRST